MNISACLCIVMVACTPFTSGVPLTFNLANFESLPDQPTGFEAPTLGAGTSSSKTAGIESLLDEHNVTIAGLEPKIIGLPDCSCPATSNEELDTLSTAVADIEGKCSDIAMTITEIESQLPSLTDKFASALSTEEFQQMTNDINQIQQTLGGFLETLGSSASGHDVDELKSSASALTGKLTEREESINQCTATCSDISSANEIEALKTEMDGIQSGGAPQLMSELISTIEVKKEQLSSTDTLMDNSAQELLTTAESQLSDISTFITANSLDNFASEDVVTELRNSISASTIAQDVEGSYQSFMDFMTAAGNMPAQSDDLKSVAELMDALHSMSVLADGVLSNHDELEGLVSSATGGMVQDTDVATALEFIDVVDNTTRNLIFFIGEFLTTTEQLAQVGNVPDTIDFEVSADTHVLRWNVIKEGLRPTICPSPFEYDEHLNLCFFIGRKGTQYSKAAGYCKALGGGLGRLISLTEEKRLFIYNLLVARGITTYYWVGMRTVNGALMWSDGRYDDWTVSFSYRSYASPACVEMDSFGLLYDGSCTYPDSFICEYPIG